MRAKVTRAALLSLLLCSAAFVRAPFAQDERKKPVPPPAGWLKFLEEDGKLNERERAVVRGADRGGLDTDADADPVEP